ncbi:MAG: hypothetical protein CMO64_07340, partial [Verrucomicrobiales bacterium]|nr:hypothetical protein [Verrucomicrobiales bacterium]
MKAKLLVVFLLVAFGAAGWGWYYYNDSNKPVASRYGTETVVNEAFMVAISEQGELAAVKSIKISSEMEGSSTIVYVVGEGEMVNGSTTVKAETGDTPASIARKHGVKEEDLRHVNPKLDEAIKNQETINIPGDLLVELDPEDLNRRINTQDIDVQKARDAVVRAEGEMRTTLLETQLTLKKAENALQNAELDLEKAQKSTVETYIQDMQGQIENFKKDIELSEKNVRAYDSLKELGFVSEVEVLREKAKAAKTAHNMKIALADLEAYKKYDQVKLISEKKLAVDEATVNVEKTKVANESEMNDANSSVATAKKTLELEIEKLDDLKDQLAKSRIYAPADGMVVYHVAESRYGSSSSSMIEKGASIRKGQDILRLPDVSKMKVELKIHESKRWQVELGNKVAVYVGEHKFKGEVKMLKDVADSTSRWTGNKKVFRCEVVIENEQLPEGIRVGSTATCQIFVANLPKEYTDENGKEVKTLKVPIQSVIGVKGNKKVVFTIDDKGKPQPTIVETGLYDQTHIQIKGGKLKEGDVILKAPLLYAKEINVGGDMFDYRKISPEDLGLEVPVYDPTTDLEGAQAQAGGTRPSGGGTRPSGGGTRPSGGGTRPSGGGGNSADAFKAPTELKLTSEQQQKWEGVAEFSKAAFDAAME